MKTGEIPIMNRYLGPNSRKITLLIIFTGIGSVISGTALLPSYNLSEVARATSGK